MKKTILKELEDEGITTELLNSFDIKNDFNPVQLNPGEDPVKLIKCSKGYWIMPEYGVYRKDNKGELIILSEKEAKISRARYKVNFAAQIEEDLLQKAAQIEEDLIQKEVSRLRKKVDDKLSLLLDALRRALILTGKIHVDGTESILFSVWRNTRPNDYSDKLRIAKNLVNDDTLEMYKLLLELKKEDNYDTLYIYLCQNGLPILTSINYQNINENILSAFRYENLMHTIADIKSHNHLYNVAKFNLMESNKI